MDQYGVRAYQTSVFFPILFLLLLYSLIFKYYKTMSQSKGPPLPPGPHPWPILGNIFQIGNKPHITLTQLAQTYGPIFSLRLGTQIVVVGSTQAAAIEILKNHDNILSGRYVPHVVPAKSLELNKFSLGFVFECNNSWRRLRSIYRSELFSGKAIEGQADTRMKKASEMVEFLCTMQGKVVTIREVAFATVLNMLSSKLVSRNIVRLEDDSVVKRMSGLVRNFMELAVAPNVSDFYPLISGLDLQNLRKKSMQLFGESCKIWDAVIKERRALKSSGDNHASSQQDFLDALINSGSTDVEIYMLLELFIAGTDSTTSTIEWTMAELIKNPVYMKKVQEELEKEIEKDAIKESHLPRLTFLQACVKETLRLQPPTPFLLPHRAVESCDVMNYTFPKNSQVLINFWAIGRDPETWEEPIVYKPERFLNLNMDFRGNDYEFIPFGAGRRVCPGLPLAAKYVALVLANLIHFFEWSLPDDDDLRDLDMKEKYALTLLKEQPLLLIPKPKI